MDYKQKILNNEFFIIDSNNYFKVKSSLYGYCINENGIFTSSNFSTDVKINDDDAGAYIIITRSSDGNLTIKQDFYGSYGIYIFESNNYFAISNSFHLLVSHICKKYKLSIDEDYLNNFLINGLCSMTISNTMVNEIYTLKNNEYLEIKDGRLFIENSKSYKINEISIDSALGMQIFDEWFFKWTRIFSKIYSNTKNISCDLSGGFDTRMVLAILLNSEIDLNQICIHSNNDKNHSEDFSIASSIADFYHFKLNNHGNLDVQSSSIAFDETISHSFALKLGFHKEMYLKNKIFDNYRYNFTGCNGEQIRCYPNKKIDDYKQLYINLADKLCLADKQKVSVAVDKLWNKDIKFIEDKYNIQHDDLNLSTTLYNFVRAKNHYGKANIENYGVNIISVNPLMDPKMMLLKKTDLDQEDGTVLMTLLFNRFCPELMNFSVENGRTFSKKSIDTSKLLCTKYPLKRKQSHNNSFSLPFPQKYESSNLIQNSLLTENKWYQSLYSTNLIHDYFCKYFSLKTYLDMYSDSFKRSFFPCRHLHTGVALSKIINDIHSYHLDTIPSLDSFFASAFNSGDYKYADIFRNIQDYLTARIEIKTINNCEWEIFDISDNGVSYSYPKWAQENGKCAIFYASNLSLSFKLSIKKEGKILIRLRGMDVKDSTGKRIPNWIDYNSLTINHKEYLDKIIPSWYMKYKDVVIDVKPNDDILVSVIWNIHKDNRQMIDQ